MKLNKKALFLLVTMAVAAGGFLKYRAGSTMPQPSAAIVETVTVKASTIPLEVETIGTLVARHVEITPEVSGHIDQILFQDGADVKQGAALIQLDDAVLRSKLASAQARLLYSENNYKRMVFLGKRGAIAKQAIDQAEADLKEKKADAEEAEVMVQKMRLLAPFTGAVGKSKVNPGDYVTVGQALVTLSDRHHLRVEYNLPEKYFSLLKTGQEVSVTTDSYPDRDFAGKVAFISPTINMENRTVSVYADLSNDANLLADGMLVHIKQTLGTQHAFMVPSRSLIPVLDGEQVYKVVDGRVSVVSVVVGDRKDKSVQILQGLAQGDVVITDGQIKVKNGMPVKIKS